MASPEPYRIVMPPRFAAELEDIFDYIAADSPANAAALIDQILQSIESLQRFPFRNITASRASRKHYPVRSLPIPPYILYFHVLPEERVVQLLRIIHGARRRPKNFG
jgi:plasmid stabilization system protein ParE